MSTETATKLEIKYVPIGDVHPWDKNPKKHNKKAIIESIKRFKPTQPILVQKGTGLIIAGHGRLEAFKELGYDEIPITELEMSDAEAHAYALVDNQTVIAGGWDYPILDEVIEELKVDFPELDLSVYDLGLTTNTNWIDDLEDRKFTDALHSELTTFAVTFDFPKEYEETLKPYLREHKVEIVHELVERSKEGVNGA